MPVEGFVPIGMVMGMFLGILIQFGSGTWPTILGGGIDLILGWLDGNKNRPHDFESQSRCPIICPIICNILRRSLRGDWPWQKDQHEQSKQRGIGSSRQRPYGKAWVNAGAVCCQGWRFVVNCE